MQRVHSTHQAKAAARMARLNQERAAVQAQRVGRLRADISAITRSPAFRDTAQCLAQGNGPRVVSAYPTTVKALDPLVLRGCGFGTTPGQAVLLYEGQERYMAVQDWSDFGITATVPDIGGFAWDKQVGVLVKTAAGGVSAILPGLTLQPTLQTAVLRGVGQPEPPNCSYGVWDYQPSYSGIQPYGYGDACTMFKMFPLRNGWRFKEVLLTYDVYKDYCDEAQSPCSASPSIYQPAPGATLVELISVRWNINSQPAWGLEVDYAVTVLVEGPVGTTLY
jgi:hypothetical protein